MVPVKTASPSLERAVCARNSTQSLSPERVRSRNSQRHASISWFVSALICSRIPSTSSTATNSYTLRPSVSSMAYPLSAVHASLRNSHRPSPPSWKITSRTLFTTVR